MTNTELQNELRRIADDHGGTLRAEDVVEAAKDEASILHSKFKWDDTEAAHLYRLQQARQLIRVVVQFVGPAEVAQRTRVFVSLTPDRHRGGEGYRFIADVMNDDELRRQLVIDALKELHRIEQRYGELKELAAVFEEIRKISSQQKAA